MYPELYEAWRKEKATVEIQKLPDDFYTKLVNYLGRIKKESRMLDTKTVKARLLQQEFLNAKRLVEELVQLRHEKILQLIAEGKSVPKNVLTPEEMKLHGQVLSLSDAYQAFLKDVLRGRLTLAEEKSRGKPRKMVVRFLQAIPAIVGADMKTYGPFRAEDVATLPIENAKVLIKQKAAVEVEVK